MSPTQMAFDLGGRPALGGEDFLVADCNREAVAWLERWPDWPAPALVIFGPASCGKTHMAQAFLARSLGREAGVVDLRDTPPADLMDSPVLVLDGAEALLAAGLEEELYHLWNIARESGRHLLLTAATPPSRWPFTLADAASRLRAAPAVGIGEPDDGLIGAVLVKLFVDRQLRVDGDVVLWLLARMERSFEAARRIVEAIDRLALEEKRNVTVPLVRKAFNALQETQGD